MNQLRQIERKALVKAALLGFLNPFLYYVVLFKAYAISARPDRHESQLRLAPGSHPALCAHSWVNVYVQASSLAVMISFIGAVIIATRGEFTSFGGVSRLGVLLAGGSTLIWATYWLFNAKDGLDPVVKLFTGFCFGLLFTTLYGLVMGGIELPVSKAWFPLIYISLFEMSITFALWLTALQLTSFGSPHRQSDLHHTLFLPACLTPVIGEKIHPATFVGLLLIVGSILFQGWMGRKRGRGKE